jgi:hypothetical protein
MQIFRRCMSRYPLWTLYQVAVVSRPTSEFCAFATVILRNLPKPCDHGMGFNDRALVLITTKINRLLPNLQEGRKNTKITLRYVNTCTRTNARTHTHTHLIS